MDIIQEEGVYVLILITIIGYITIILDTMKAHVPVNSSNVFGVCFKVSVFMEPTSHLTGSSFF